jgi:6-O-methylguanine DNA methyltransferase, DNA binding domain
MAARDCGRGGRIVDRLCLVLRPRASYRYDIALQIGRPTAVRAVGLANGANPIAIVILAIG